MTTLQYIQNLDQRYRLGNATEHTFRGDLQQLIESIVPKVSSTNEPKRQSCGAPGYILIKKDVPVGFIEAKDIGDKDLEGKKRSGNGEQFDRYPNFQLYRDGEERPSHNVHPSPSCDHPYGFVEKAIFVKGVFRLGRTSCASVSRRKESYPDDILSVFAAICITNCMPPRCSTLLYYLLHTAFGNYHPWSFPL